MLYLFHSDLEKQKNTLCVYRVGSIFLFFRFIFKTKNSCNGRHNVLSKEITFQSGTDGFKNSNLQRNYYYLQLKKEEELKISLY